MRKYDTKEVRALLIQAYLAAVIDWGGTGDEREDSRRAMVDAHKTANQLLLNGEDAFTSTPK